MADPSTLTGVVLISELTIAPTVLHSYGIAVVLLMLLLSDVFMDLVDFSRDGMSRWNVY